MSFCSSLKMSNWSISTQFKQKLPELWKWRDFKARKMFSKNWMSILKLSKLIFHQTQIFLQRSEIINRGPIWDLNINPKQFSNVHTHILFQIIIKIIFKFSNVLLCSCYLFFRYQTTQKNWTSKTFSSSSRRTLQNAF